jgi:hypothetical protein
MSLIENVEFNEWLDNVAEVDRGCEPPFFGCTSCGSSPRVYPFIGEYCMVCLAEMYGRYSKSLQVAEWIEEHSWLWARGSIKERAAQIYAL